MGFNEALTDVFAAAVNSFKNSITAAFTIIGTPGNLDVVVLGITIEIHPFEGEPFQDIEEREISKVNDIYHRFKARREDVRGTIQNPGQTVDVRICKMLVSSVAIIKPGDFFVDNATSEKWIII